ncbi:transposable element Tcb1 transposase [Trichonephila clavipes]|nr:transposable element Tcb1 transposase [Trichonephila clavipes]
MTIVFVCEDPVVKPQSCFCFTVTHLSHSWCDSMGVIVYNTWAPLVLLRGTMPAQPYVHDNLQPHVLPLMQRLPGAIFQQDTARSIRPECHKAVPHFYYPSLTCSIPRFVSNRACIGSFGTTSWVLHGFEKNSGKVRADMERNVSRHYTELVSLNARSYRIVLSCQKGFKKV